MTGIAGTEKESDEDKKDDDKVKKLSVEVASWTKTIQPNQLVVLASQRPNSRDVILYHILYYLISYLLLLASDLQRTFRAMRFPYRMRKWRQTRRK